MTMIRFNINYQKALHSILWIARANDGINIYNLLKVFFSADCYHLNHYGRPVTGDAYIAMEYGLVPSVVYNIIKGDEITLNFLGINEVPFNIKNHILKPKDNVQINEGLLSESDMEALHYGLEEYGKLDFHRVKEKNHTHKAWLNTNINSQVDYELMIENQEVIEDLKENSQYIVI